MKPLSLFISAPLGKAHTSNPIRELNKDANHTRLRFRINYLPLEKVSVNFDLHTLKSRDLSLVQKFDIFFCTTIFFYSFSFSKTQKDIQKWITNITFEVKKPIEIKK